MTNFGIHVSFCDEVVSIKTTLSLTLIVGQLLSAARSVNIQLEDAVFVKVKKITERVIFINYI